MGSPKSPSDDDQGRALASWRFGLGHQRFSSNAAPRCRPRGAGRPTRECLVTARGATFERGDRQQPEQDGAASSGGVGSGNGSGVGLIACKGPIPGRIAFGTCARSSFIFPDGAPAGPLERMRTSRERVSTLQLLDGAISAPWAVSSAASHVGRTRSRADEHPACTGRAACSIVRSAAVTDAPVVSAAPSSVCSRSSRRSRSLIFSMSKKSSGVLEMSRCWDRTCR